MFRGMDEHSGGKKMRLAIIKFLATLLVALCTFCAESEDNMINENIISTSTESNKIDAPTNRPSP